MAGAGLDVFDVEPPKDWRLASLPQVVATPHIAASTKEAQEQVGTETAAALRDFLKEGIIRNAVNFPSVSLEEYRRLRPYLTLAKYLGLVVAQMGEARIGAVGVRYYGELAGENNQLLGSAVLEGVFSRHPVVGRRHAGQRADDRRRARHRADRVAQHPGTELHQPHLRKVTHSAPSAPSSTRRDGDRWVEGTVFANGSLRLVLVDGVGVEAPLEGTLLIIKNNDQPGVIGDVGTLLGRHSVNIASFALGRDPECATIARSASCKVDEHPERGPGRDGHREVLAEIRAIPNIRSVWRVRLDAEPGSACRSTVRSALRQPKLQFRAGCIAEDDGFGVDRHDGVRPATESPSPTR